MAARRRLRPHGENISPDNEPHFTELIVELDKQNFAPPAAPIYIGGIKSSRGDRMAQEQQPAIVRQPTDEQIRAAFEAYTLAVGKVAHAWNYLHEKLGQLFAVITGADREIALAIWYSTDSDRTPPNMLKRQLLPQLLNAGRHFQRPWIISSGCLIVPTRSPNPATTRSTPMLTLHWRTRGWWIGNGGVILSWAPTSEKVDGKKAHRRI